MDLGTNRRRRSMPVTAISTVLALLATCALSAATANATTVTTFCTESYPGNGYCNQGHPHAIWWIDAQASADAFCVMRATEGSAGAPSASGKEYCAGSGSGGFVYQEFHGFTGYAQTHNRHSYVVEATCEFEYS